MAVTCEVPLPIAQFLQEPTPEEWLAEAGDAGAAIVDAYKK